MVDGPYTGTGRPPLATPQRATQLRLHAYFDDE